MDFQKLTSDRVVGEPHEPAELIECPECGVAKGLGVFSSTLDCCGSCEPDVKKRAAKDLERQYWAEQRAAGKAAFIRHDSARGAFNKGQAVIYCVTCEGIVIGSDAIKKHVKRCRR